MMGLRPTLTDTTADLSARAASLVALGLSGFAFAVVLVTTRGGMVVTADSVFYASAARNLAAGRGVVDFAGAALVHWPPGLSVLLAGGLKLGLSIETSARLINASSAALIVWCTFRVGVPKLPSRRLAVLAAAIVAVAPALLNAEDSIWSEPVFTVLVVAFLLLLDTMQTRRSLGLVALAGTVAGVATLVRYLGFSLIVAGILVLVLTEHRRIRECVLRIAMFGSAATVVVLPWLIRNYDASGSAATTGGKTSGIGPTAKALLVALGRLELPRGAPEPVVIAAVIGAALFVLAACIWFRLTWRSASPIMSWLIVLAALAGFMTVTSFTGSSDLDARILAPAVPPLVLCALWLFGTISRRPSSDTRRQALRVTSVLAMVGVVVLSAYGLSVEWRAGSQGRARAAPAVRDSEIVRAVGSLPANTTVVADDSLPIVSIAYWTARTPILTVGDGSDAVEGTTTTARQVATLACKGNVTYMRSRHPSTLARSFEHAAQGLLVFEKEKALSDGEALRVHPAQSSVCAGRNGAVRRS
jgi:4-amino-4-deoxy-L-arabinose transferase-like glycosyltransferase